MEQNKQESLQISPEWQKIFSSEKERKSKLSNKELKALCVEMVRSQWWQVVKEVIDRSISNISNATVRTGDDIKVLELRDTVKGMMMFQDLVEDFGGYSEYIIGKDKDSNDE